MDVVVGEMVAHGRLPADNVCDVVSIVREQSVGRFPETFVILELSQEVDEVGREHPSIHQRLFGGFSAGVHRILGDELGTLRVVLGESTAFGATEPRGSVLDS